MNYLRSIGSEIKTNVSSLTGQYRLYYLSVLYTLRVLTGLRLYASSVSYYTYLTTFNLNNIWNNHSSYLQKIRPGK